MNVGTDENFIKIKFSQEIINNGEKQAAKSKREANESG